MVVDLSLARKAAILAYLTTDGVSYRELGARFGQTWQSMRDEIRDLFMVEVPSGGFYDSAFDLYMDDDYEDATADTHVYLSAFGDSEYPAPSLTLNEVISLLGIVDHALQASDSADAGVLATFRSRLSEAVANAGYESMLWPAPARRAGQGIIDALTEAIENHRRVTLSYWKAGGAAGPQAVEATVAPVAVSTGPQPVLVCANEDDAVRTYRLDRIFNVIPTEQKFPKVFARRILKEAKSETGIGSIPVTLTTTPRARWLGEYLVGSTIERSGDHLTVSFTASSRAWLTSLVIRLGDDLVAIEPDDVRAAIVEHIGEYGASL